MVVMNNMAKKKKATADVVILLVEGATEVEFYKKLLISLNRKYAPESCVIRQPIDMKGIGNFKNGAVRQFNIDATNFKKSKRYNQELDYVYHVFMCIDTDVFEFQSNPPINKEKVKESINKANVIPHFIEACHSIEDWFLEDLDGIADFLKTNKTNLSTKVKGKNGADKLDNLFRPFNKRYTKGVKCEGLVDKLDVVKIFNNHQNEFSELISLLNTNL